MRDGHAQPPGIVSAAFVAVLRRRIVAGQPPDRRRTAARPPLRRRWTAMTRRPRDLWGTKTFVLGSVFERSRGTETSPEPGSNRMYNSANRRTNQDMCSVKMTYLRKQEEFCNENNFHAFYTQLGVNPNWNHLQRYSDAEDTNFTNRRFYSLSICEYPSLEDVSSPMKKRSDPKKLMEFNMDLLSFQKAKNEEKSPRKYGVMAQFPKPVKPILQLPNLESHRFNLSQTKQWRPGEVYKHLRSISSDSGGVEEFLPCTKAHMIRRIYLWPHLPYLEPLAIKLQQLFSYQLKHDLSTFQTVKKVLRKLSYPLKPSRLDWIKRNSKSDIFTVYPSGLHPYR
ncbi:hypothetical protein F2Q69_00029638 [Brassica cretica]|uniref:Uncharacterized protein n=1 Tax=Brassica cretica TaxID=69181 RepID=A0A8S9S1G1_BRACR|nr:hypothetical protein F2Q69_00029638 [Brassica cretica]